MDVGSWVLGRGYKGGANGVFGVVDGDLSGGRWLLHLHLDHGAYVMAGFFSLEHGERQPVWDSA